MSKLAIKATSKFKKDYKAAIKRGLDISLLEAIIKKLANQEPLPPENRDHQLSGIGLTLGNAIFFLTGYLYTKSKLMCWF